MFVFWAVPTSETTIASSLKSAIPTMLPSLGFLASYWKECLLTSAHHRDSRFENPLVAQRAEVLEVELAVGELWEECVQTIGEVVIDDFVGGLDR